MQGSWPALSHCGPVECRSQTRVPAGPREKESAPVAVISFVQLGTMQANPSFCTSPARTENCPQLQELPMKENSLSASQPVRLHFKNWHEQSVVTELEGRYGRRKMHRPAVYLDRVPCCLTIPQPWFLSTEASAAGNSQQMRRFLSSPVFPGHTL